MEKNNTVTTQNQGERNELIPYDARFAQLCSETMKDHMT